MATLLNVVCHNDCDVSRLIGNFVENSTLIERCILEELWGNRLADLGPPSIALASAFVAHFQCGSAWIADLYPAL
jgi:hypothetical protein